MSKSPVATLPSGKGTQNTESIGGPAPIERGKNDDTARVKRDPEGDTIRRQEDKARWPGYGSDDASTATLLNEQRGIEGKGPLSHKPDGGKKDPDKGKKEGEGEGDTKPKPEALTKAQLSEALTAAKVEHDPAAKKDELVELYKTNKLDQPAE